MNEVKRWCGRAAAGSETAAMNPMVEWHGDTDEDTPYVLASDYDAMCMRLERVSDLSRRLIRAEERMARTGEEHPEYGEALSDLARLHSDLQREFPEVPSSWLDTKGK